MQVLPMVASSGSGGLSLPESRVPLTVRLATGADLPWMDALQKANTKALGFFPRAQLEGYIASGGVLVAEAETAGTAPVGYVVYRDRYLKRDELGVIYQLCVSPAPGMRRSLIGANLIKAAFERSAWGCRLYCCWCAQDLEANRFWEALGFVPIAFRGGSTKKSRTHIFWQKPIRAEDAAAAGNGTFRGWWFPNKTDQGAMRADRLVFPIPPGVHWSEVKAPEVSSPEEEEECLAKSAKGAKKAKAKGPEVGSVGGPREPTNARRQFGGRVRRRPRPRKRPRK